MFNETAYAAFHLTLFAGSAAVFIAFNCASYSPQDSSNRAMGWHSFLPCVFSCWIAVDVICFLTFCLRKFARAYCILLRSHKREKTD